MKKTDLEKYSELNEEFIRESDRFSIMFEKSIGKVQYEDVKMVA